MTRKVTVLGIHDGHNAGAALIRDGRVIAALNEERLNNIKNCSGAPLGAIEKVFQIANIPPQEVDIIALVGLLRTPGAAQSPRLGNRFFAWISPFVHSHLFANQYIKLLHHLKHGPELEALFQQLGIGDREVFCIDHHLSHAATAFYQRPWDDDTLVMTLDGAGDGLCATVSKGSGFSMERIATTIYYDSPSNVLYSEITGYLGLKRWEHEYKVMGMAPYGRPEVLLESMRKIIRINPGKPLEFQNTSRAYLSGLQPKLRRILAEQRFDNVAAACQLYFEQLLTQWVTNGLQATGLRKIACSGGSFLNVKANKLLREMEGVDDIFVYPAAEDGGTAVGAALEAYYRYCERESIEAKRSHLEDMYYGQSWENDDIKSLLQQRNLLKKASYSKDISGEIASLLAKGKIIARFSGRDEWGPRALGNRSILADPRDMKVIRKINFAIKYRDFWMPFAPSIMDEWADKYIINGRPARYMVEAFDTTERGEEIIAALHPYDLTTRPQMVNNSQNKVYRKVLEEFQRQTGVGGVLNTSFNLHGYPIVGSPEIALNTLEQSSLDGLAIEDWMVMK